MKRSIRILAGATIGAIVGLTVAIATRSWWLPERYAINVPVASITGGAPPLPSAPMWPRS